MVDNEKMTNKPRAIIEIQEEPNNQISLWEDRYLGSRVVIRNPEDYGANNCMGYIILPEKEKKLRISWAVPNSKDQRDVITINAKDNGYLDLCAFLKSNIPEWKKRKTQSLERRNEVIEEKYPQIIAPKENGFNFSTGDHWVIDGITECGVLITSDNADPVGARIKIDDKRKTIEVIPLDIENDHILEEWLYKYSP